MIDFPNANKNNPMSNHLVSVERHSETIRRIVESHRASNPRLFGSVAKGVATDQSDIDILVDPASDMSLFDIGAIREELRCLLNAEVDVLTPNAIPVDFRDRVLEEARPI